METAPHSRPPAGHRPQAADPAPEPWAEELAELELVEPAVEPWRPGPLPLSAAIERLVLLERFRAMLDAEAVGLRVRVLTAYR
ncbi:hypothetical protein, partial [Arthrobacter ginkgonis]|uniref:hypothetical protein n=1 Tax=Arthrobacter ginkgonis TaxID=1630594 RepID=UPI0031EEED8B